MTGVYDLSNPDDRVRLALAQPTREHRKAVVGIVRRRCGEAAAQALKDALIAMGTKHAA